MRWPRYGQMKASGVAWLGEVPRHWDVMKIKRRTRVKRGASPRPIDDPIYFDDAGEYSWVRISDVTASEKYLEQSEQTLSSLGASLSVKLEPGVMFLSIAATVGKPIITKLKCCIHDGFVYFPDLTDSSDFLYYVFASGEPYQGLGKLGTQLNLNTDTVADIEVAWPPPDEQHAIATFLDRETARIDALVAAKRRLIALLHEKRAALIARAVTRGLDPDLPTKDSGVAWLGWVPAHWEVMPLKRAVDVRGGLTPDKSNADYWGGEVPWVTAKDMKRPRLANSEDHTTAFALSETSLRWVEPPAVLIVVRGMILAHTFPVAEIDAAVTINQDMKALLPKPGVDSSYLAWLLRGASAFLLSGAEESAHGTKALRTEIIFNVSIPMPPPEEQRTIATHIESMAGKLGATMLKVESAIARLTEYRSTLITSAVTGRIDVRAAA